MREYDELKRELNKNKLMSNKKKIMNKNYTPLVNRVIASKIFKQIFFINKKTLIPLDLIKIENVNIYYQKKKSEVKFSWLCIY